jgi:hypothetical protein
LKPYEQLAGPLTFSCVRFRGLPRRMSKPRKGLLQTTTFDSTQGALLKGDNN